MQQTSSPHSRFLTSRKQYWCLKKCSSLDFSFRPELQARPNKRKEHCGRSGGWTLFCQVSTSAIVLSKISSSSQICLRVRSKRKLINCDSFCPTQNFDMDYQVPHQHESPSASAQWLQFQEVWVYPFNELKYLLGVFHWSLVFQGTFCCNSWSYSSTWSLMWSSRLTHRWENRIHCTFI